MINILRTLVVIVVLVFLQGWRPAIIPIIAIPVFALVRRWLSPALPDDPRRRRRRAYTTGGLSPLSRA